MYEYNSSKPRLILAEYGRNIQKLVEYLSTIEDKEKRNRYAHTLIELMRQLNPDVKEGSESTQKLWDDLYIMSNFTLDVDAPFPIPEPEILNKKPQKVPYHRAPIKYKHYGKNIEMLIEKAANLTEPEEKKAAIIAIGKLMKSFYITWNKDSVEDEVILKNIRELSREQLDIPMEEVKQGNLFDSSNKGRSGGSKSRRSPGKKKK
jgi:hypothetical protein